jgi:hypothetical protein
MKPFGKKTARPKIRLLLVAYSLLRESVLQAIAIAQTDSKMIS